MMKRTEVKVTRLGRRVVSGGQPSHVSGQLLVISHQSSPSALNRLSMLLTYFSMLCRPVTHLSGIAPPSPPASEPISTGVENLPLTALQTTKTLSDRRAHSDRLETTRPDVVDRSDRRADAADKSDNTDGVTGRHTREQGLMRQTDQTTGPDAADGTALCFTPPGDRSVLVLPFCRLCRLAAAWRLSGHGT